MKRTQRGVTMIGWICLLIPIAIVGYSAIRLIPVYLNYTKILRSIDQIAKETRTSDTGANIRYALEKRLDIEQIEFPDVKDFDIHREGQTWVMGVDYEDSVPLLSNVYIAAKFSKSVRIGDQGE